MRPAHSRLPIAFLYAFLLCVTPHPVTGTLVAFGTSANGETGLGTAESVQQPAGVPTLATTTITAIACGNSHSIVVADSEVYTFGYGGSGQLGLGDTASRLTPQRLSFFSGKSVTAVSAGRLHTAVVADKSLYTFGAGDKGQLGYYVLANQLLPKIVSTIGGVTLVAAGDYHTLVATANAVYSFGDGSFGQLGHGDTYSRFEPTRITALDGRTVTALAAGVSHSAVLTSDGTLFVFGDGQYGALGLGNTSTRLFPVALRSDVAIVAAGAHCTALVTNTGYLYTFGFGGSGRLGYWTAYNAAPKLVDKLSNVTAVALSPSVPAGHTVVICCGGIVYTFGNPQDGRLGYPATVSSADPQTIGLSQARLASAGAGFSLVDASFTTPSSPSPKSPPSPSPLSPPVPHTRTLTSTPTRADFWRTVSPTLTASPIIIFMPTNDQGHAPTHSGSAVAIIFLCTIVGCCICVGFGCFGYWWCRRKIPPNALAPVYLVPDPVQVQVHQPDSTTPDGCHPADTQAVETQNTQPPNRFICPIGLSVMTNPYMDSEGHNFEQANILGWLCRQHVCPIARHPLEPQQLAPNRALKEEIEEWTRVHGGPAPQQ